MGFYPQNGVQGFRNSAQGFQIVVQEIWFGEEFLSDIHLFLQKGHCLVGRFAFF